MSANHILTLFRVQDTASFGNTIFRIGQLNLTGLTAIL